MHWHGNSYLHRMNNWVSRSVIIKVFILVLLLTSACGSSRQTRKQRDVSRIQAERQKEATKQYKEAVKRHHSIQSKDTRKRIEKNKKKAPFTP